MTDAEYLLRFHRFQKNREKQFAPILFKIIRDQYQTVIDNKHLGSAAVLKITSVPLVTILQKLYKDAATVYGAKVFSDLRKKEKKSIPVIFEIKARMPIGFSATMEQLIKQYFHADILKTSEGITQTTKDLITKVFSEAYTLGLGIDDIIKKLENTELSKIRARLIARTETVTAANKGAMFVAKQTGLNLNKTWLSAGDNRVRDDHRDINGRTVGIDDYFNVGGFDMQQPGDRGGKGNKLGVPPKEICNCRCTVIFRKIKE